MIDKNAQRQRAQDMSQTLAAQGLVAPKLSFPVSTPKAPAASGPKDMEGTVLREGQKVARAESAYGYGSNLRVQTVTKVDGLKVYLDHSPQALKKLENVLVLK